MNRDLFFTTEGASHSEKITMKLFGIRKGESFDMRELQKFVDRRKAVNAVYSTKRKEPDELILVQGIENGFSTGEPIIIEVKNTCQRSEDYESKTFIPRPSHADYPAYVKYKGGADLRGGGVFSGRMTLPSVIAGGLAEQILNKKGITVGAYVLEIGGISGGGYDNISITAERLNEMKSEEFPLVFPEYREKMLKKIEAVAFDADSVGGKIEGVVIGVPTGTGELYFDGLESRLARALFAIPAIKGLEFGSGFDLSRMRGSQANDCYAVKEGRIVTKTNNNGGILGGIATGMPITLRVAVKPTPSIGKEQDSVALNDLMPTTLKITGRHDSCIVPRAVVCVEAAIAFTLLEYLY